MDTRKVTLFATIAVIAMVAVGIGYALTYYGSASNEGNSAAGEHLTVSLKDSNNMETVHAYTGFLTGVYSLNTETRWYTSDDISGAAAGTTELTVAGPGATFKELTKTVGDESVVYTQTTTSYELDKLYVGGFNYAGSTLSQVAGTGNYNCVKVGSLNAIIHQSNDATISTVNLSISGIAGYLDAGFHEHGMSLVYGYKVGELDEVLKYNAGNLSFDVALSEHQAIVEFNAYILYPKAIQQLAQVSYEAINCPEHTITFVATANDAGNVWQVKVVTADGFVTPTTIKNVVKGGSLGAGLVFQTESGKYVETSNFYTCDSLNGLTVTRTNAATITIAGTPTADTVITLTDATDVNQGA